MLQENHIKWAWVFAGVLGCTVWPTGAQAGPWTKATGEAYLKVSEIYFGADNFVSTVGGQEQIEGAEYTAYTSAFYGEVGLPGRFQLSLFLPWVWSKNYDEASSGHYANVGFGDAIVGLQHTIVDTKLPWSLRLDAKVPLYDVNGIEGPLASQFPALGDGQLDLTPWASVGGSLYPVPLYVLGEVGYRFRTDMGPGEGTGLDYKDSFVGHVQVGYTVIERVLVAADVQLVYALEEEDTFTQSFLTAGPQVALKLMEGVSLEANYTPMVWAQNASQGQIFGLGISYNRSMP